MLPDCQGCDKVDWHFITSVAHNGALNHSVQNGTDLSGQAEG
jgi:hypothetical protein